MGSAEDLAGLEKRIVVVERLALRIIAEEGDRRAPTSAPPERFTRKPTAKRAIIQVLDDADRSMMVREIQPSVEKLMGRDLSRQAVLSALVVAVRNNEVKRVARGLYRRVDQT